MPVASTALFFLLNGCADEVLPVYHGYGGFSSTGERIAVGMYPETDEYRGRTLDAEPPDPVGFSESERSPTTHEEWRVARRSFLESICGRDACCKLVVAGGRAAHAEALLGTP